MATRNLDLTIADEIRHLNFDEVRARVVAADPQTFYRKAAAFEQAAERFELFGEQLRRYRAELESVWHNGDPRQYEWADRMLRYIDELTVSLREPGYPAVLRRVGDAVAQSQQRLRGLENHSGSAMPDESARLARDEHARQILADLSTSYVQSGMSLAELPERGATGRQIHVPVTPVEGLAGHHVMATASMTPGRAGHGMGVSQGVVVSVSPVDGGVPRSAAAEPFGRLSHFATSRPAPVSADQPATFSGFAGMALSAAEGAVPPFVSAAPAAGAGRGEKAAQRGEAAPSVTSSAKLQATTLVTASAAPPATVSADPATAAARSTGVAHPVTVAGQPATGVAAAAAPATVSAAHPGAAAAPVVASGAPAALQSTGVSPVISAAAAPTPAVAPPVPPTLAPRPPLPGEFPAMSTSLGGSAAPLGDVHPGPGHTGTAASTGAVPPPAAMGAGPAAGGPVSRVDSTWLRADPGTWSGGNTHGAATRPGLGTGGGGCVPTGVIGHSENGKGDVR